MLAPAPALAQSTMSAAMASEFPQTFGMLRAEVDGTKSFGKGLLNWDVDGWYGSDSDKVWLKSEGLLRGSELDDGEAQILWSHAVSDFWDLQAGMRQVFAPAGESYAALGVQGLARDFFETEATLFIGTRGDVQARVRQSLDLPITRHWYVQPHGEINLASRNIPRERLGAGLAQIQLGLQTRYEIARKVAPYLDIVWSQALANSVVYDRIADDPPSEVTLRAGLRIWF